jgi:hypothetical protein
LSRSPAGALHPCGPGELATEMSTEERELKQLELENFALRSSNEI